MRIKSKVTVLGWTGVVFSVLAYIPNDAPRCLS
jgi:hypothetical protein